MAIIQAILTMLLQQSGKLLNTVFGWATTMLFGKLPEDRQLYLSVTALGSVLWIVVLLGVAFPSLGTFLLAFVPLSSQIDPFWVRMIMLAAVVLLPLGVGAVSLFLVNPDQRPKGKDKFIAILKGYPYTLGLSLTLILVCLVTPFLKLQDLWRRWTTVHVPVVIEPEAYLDVVATVERTAEEDGIETRREKAPWVLRLPTRIFSVLGGGPAATMMANELTVLRSGNFELILHPSDLVIRGKEADVVHVRALIAEHLVFSKAYLTWTKEANELEERITAIWQETAKHDNHTSYPDVMSRLNKLAEDVRKVKLSYEEWEVLLRERLLLEQRLLRQTVEAEPERRDPELSPAHG